MTKPKLAKPVLYITIRVTIIGIRRKLRACKKITIATVCGLQDCIKLGFQTNQSSKNPFLSVHGKMIKFVIKFIAIFTPVPQRVACGSTFILCLQAFIIPITIKIVEQSLRTFLYVSLSFFVYISSVRFFIWNWKRIRIHRELPFHHHARRFAIVLVYAGGNFNLSVGVPLQRNALARIFCPGVDRVQTFHVWFRPVTWRYSLKVVGACFLYIQFIFWNDTWRFTWVASYSTRGRSIRRPPDGNTFSRVILANIGWAHTEVAVSY